MALSDDDTLLAVNIDHDIGIFDVADGEFKLKYLLKGHRGYVSAVAFQPSSNTTLVSSSSVNGPEHGTHIRLWDLSEHSTVDDQHHSTDCLTEAARLANNAVKNYLIQQVGWSETDLVPSDLISQFEKVLGIAAAKRDLKLGEALEGTLAPFNSFPFTRDNSSII